MWEVLQFLAFRTSQELFPLQTTRSKILRTLDGLVFARDLHFTSETIYTRTYTTTVRRNRGVYIQNTSCA